MLEDALIWIGDIWRAVLKKGKKSMATCYIEEFGNLAHDANGNVIPVPDTLVTNQKVAVGAGSVQSSAVNAQTKYIVLITDTACQYAIGANPTASATSSFLPANVPVARKVAASDKVAIIQQQ